MLKFALTRNVTAPQRATAGAAGIDFYYPNDQKLILIEPGESVKIPSGVKVELPIGYALKATNRSSVAANKALIVGACLVDNDYQGEIFINLINVGVTNQIVEPGDKIIQFRIVRDYSDMPIEIVPEHQIHEKETKRGTGGFGSTN